MLQHQNQSSGGFQPPKIVVTGPESSGKTRLAGDLAACRACDWTPEFARYYLAHLGRPYGRADLRDIGRGQRLWEDWHGARAGTRGWITDTDWTVLQIWEQFLFPDTGVWEWQKGYGVTENASLYLLCAPDFPWEPDPLREHPEAREELFGLYEALLQRSNASYIIMRGTPEERLQTALESLYFLGL